MDEKGFIRFLNDKGKKAKYLSHVTTVERYLSANFGKSLEEANKNDIRACTALLTSNPTYPYGVRLYYQYLDNANAKEIIKIINTEIIPKLRKPKPQNFLRWTEFRNRMKQLEKKGISARDKALLNILWSRMKVKQIRHLRKSDINFEKKVITTRPPDQKTYRVTPEAWEALNHIPIERRGERKKLFPKITSDRAVQTITKKHFGIMKITPNRLRLSCEKDLYEAGKQTRFSVLDKKPSSRIEKPPKKKQKRRLFLRLVEAIENFGRNNHHRMSTIKDEEEFQRILEGYLRATFPDETITPELPYKGYDETSPRTDFAVGKAPKIPIELKFARGNIRDYLAEGSGQVKEFLKSSGSKKGILAILSEDRGRVHERTREFSGLQNGDVHVVMI